MSEKNEATDLSAANLNPAPAPSEKEQNGPEYVETVAENRKEVAAAKDEAKMSRINLAKSLQKAGYSNEGIAKYMGIAESSVRELLK